MWRWLFALLGRRVERRPYDWETECPELVGHPEAHVRLVYRWPPQ